MNYSEELMKAYVKENPGVYNEIEALDVKFRFRRERKFEKRKKIAPWIMMGRQKYQQEEFDIWTLLHNGEISELEAIKQIRGLMELYYFKGK